VKRSPRPDELRLWARVAATVRPSPGRQSPTPTATDPIPASAFAESTPAAQAAGGRPAKSTPAPPARVGLTASEWKNRTPDARPGAFPLRPPPHPSAGRAPAGLEPIEPGRMRRLTREREGVGPRLDLHGLDRDRARAALGAFLRRARDEGWRTVLVITGKGSRGDGVLRKSAPEWLADPGLRDLVAGVSAAHRRHGGDGALYVALKRAPAADR
jgi:DNA-nicking Smr family endonuclease